jgi:pimeloyl-ACP methyl ester carboxylesterase
VSEILLLAAAKRGVSVPPAPHNLTTLAELAASIFLRPMRSGRRVPREAAYLETARRLTIPTHAGELVAWEWGDGAAPLVGFVHGWEGHGAQLGAFAAPLVQAGFRVLTFDAPGHGESPGEEAHVPLLARLLPEIEAQRGKFHALIGHSMGAAGAAMSTAHGVAPRGLVLLAPPMSMRERVERVANRLQLDDALRAAFFDAVARRTRATFEDVDMRRVAERAPCTLLVFHDPEDADTSFAEAEKIVAAWRGARLVPCPGRGHYRILATPEIVRQTVEFIAGLRT